MPPLGVRADDERQLELRESIQELLPPSFGTLRSRRQVSRTPRAGIAESHGQDRETLWIVERLAIDAEPIAKPIATRIVEGNAGFVDASTRRLSRDEDAGLGVDLKHGANAVLQVVYADATIANVANECIEVALHGLSST